MTSRKALDEAYVWIWLPHATEPVVAGLLTRDGKRFSFNYGRSYLDRNDSIPIYEPELPLIRGAIAPRNELMVESGVPLTPELDLALFHGSSLGGARPKAMIEGKDCKFIAKFSSSTDTYNVVKAEYIAMRLAAEAGLDVATVQLHHTAGKDVILIERFDRTRTEGGWQRRLMVSALTMFGLDEMMARYASYEDLTNIIRKRFDAPKTALRELFGRLVFNIICGNTDDHARNHAAFWDGNLLKLTPAYDICPQNRTGNEATQAMLIIGQNRMSNLAVCLDAAPKFLLNGAEAIEIIAHSVDTVRACWASICDEAELSEVDRRLLRGRMFLNPFIFEGGPQAISRLAVI